MDLIADLEGRGLVHDTTDRDVLRARLAAGPIGAYVGFDPTADSLHVGHLMGQIGLRRFQMAGHRPVALAGGATGMVGDPGGRSEERNLLDRDTLRHNVASIKAQLERILDFQPGRSQAILVDNADWTEPMGVLEFLRDVGKHVTVNQMMAKESVRSRLDSEHGISYTEFSYMLLQANDFQYLFEHHGVELQMGGSDQWGNITAGIELVRRRHNHTVHGVTWPLLTKSDGTKFGKSAAGAVWLDPTRTSPYQFRQFWVQAGDDVVERYLLQFTFRSIEEIAVLMQEHRAAPERRIAQRALAADLTTLVHGSEAEARAAEAAEILFGGDPAAASAAALAVVAAEVPTIVRTSADLGDLVGVLTAAGLATSNGDARRNLQQGTYRVNGRPLTPADQGLDQVTPLHGRWLLLRRGRTAHALVEISSGPG
jgi:tyrosyl-tRNA synthetase